MSGILPRGGTIIGTSRTNPFKLEGGVEHVLRNFSDRGLDALVAIGGEDTLGVAARLHAEHQLPVVGVPKTIDNDLSGTDYTFGFDTAVFIATEAIDRLHTTAESHNRVMVVEVMGRHTGWIAVMSGIAGGADVILVPEIPVDFEEVAETIRKRHARGKNFSIVVVSEGCELPGLADAGEQDQFGHVILSQRGVGDALGREIEERTGFETRVTVLGHVQRGGSPTPRDRVLATRFGLKAADLALARRVRADGRAARGRRDRGAARRGDRAAEGRAARVVRRRARVLRLDARRRSHFRRSLADERRDVRGMDDHRVARRRARARAPRRSVVTAGRRSRACPAGTAASRLEHRLERRSPSSSCGGTRQEDLRDRRELERPLELLLAAHLDRAVEPEPRARRSCRRSSRP